MIDRDAISAAVEDAIDIYMLETFTLTVDMLAELWEQVDKEEIG